jgi:PKD repeat protein
VRFVGWATGQGVRLAWRLNGEEFATGAEAERVFEQEGRYEVVLVATDGTGRAEHTNAVVSVVERPLQVAFSAPSEARSGQDVQFANDTQPVERVVGWFWDFGDGGSSTERNPLHRFVNQGEVVVSFNVTLWATNRTGKAYSSDPQPIAVLPAQKPVPPPKAAFRILGGPFKAGRMVAFQDESTGLIEAFLWDFNGEGSDERKNPEFRFETAGAKTIRLTVRGPGGAHTASQQITVEPREVSAQVVWLNTNGQSIALPSRLDYGLANPVHVRNQELVVSVDDTFEVLLPAERQPGCSVTLALDEAAAQVFDLEERVNDSFRPLATPARLQESGRFRVKLRPDATEGECGGALVVRAEGPGLLLNGKTEPITVALHINISSGGPPPLGWLVLLLVAGVGLLLAWVFLRKRPLVYPVALTLEEIAPPTPSGGAAPATACVPPRTFRLDHPGGMVCLGRDPDHTLIYDLNAPDWFIMAKDQTLELCSRKGGPGRKLKSGESLLVNDATNRSRQVKITFKSEIRKKPSESKTHTNRERSV